jgi:hypothetical protein
MILANAPLAQPVFGTPAPPPRLLDLYHQTAAGFFPLPATAGNRGPFMKEIGPGRRGEQSSRRPGPLAASILDGVLKTSRVLIAFYQSDQYRSG